MEIIVRKADLVKELQLVQGIVERKNSIPILSNVLAEAKERRAAHRRHRPRRLPALRLRRPRSSAEGAITLGAKKLYEIARSLPESDVRIKVLPDAWASIECERVSFKMAGLPKEDFPALPEAKAGKGDRDPGGRPAGPHRPHRLRHHRRGRALLPGGRAPRPRQGRRGHGGHGRAPALLRPSQGARSR